MQAPQSPPPSTAAPGPLLLLVEDVGILQDVMQRLLTRNNFRVLLASNGLQAVDMCRASMPELILMDLGLPVMGGFVATALLKGDAATRHIPIIALTAHVVQAERDNATKAGCDSYLTKPIDMVVLDREVRRLLAMKHSAC